MLSFLVFSHTHTHIHAHTSMCIARVLEGMTLFTILINTNRVEDVLEGQAGNLCSTLGPTTDSDMGPITDPFRPLVSPPESETFAGVL